MHSSLVEILRRKYIPAHQSIILSTTRGHPVPTLATPARLFRNDKVRAISATRVALCAQWHVNPLFVGLFRASHGFFSFIFRKRRFTDDLIEPILGRLQSLWI